MRYSGTWLTPQDEAILEHLRDYGPATPEDLYERGVIAYSRAFIEERCSQLAGRDRLVSFADGVYRLTDRGRTYLDGELDPDELAAE
ncbi:MAG: MarR family transcriptional regulator [Halobacteriales archaeon]